MRPAELRLETDTSTVFPFVRLHKGLLSIVAPPPPPSEALCLCQSERSGPAFALILVLRQRAAVALVPAAAFFNFIVCTTDGDKGDKTLETCIYCVFYSRRNDEPLHFRSPYGLKLQVAPGCSQLLKVGSKAAFDFVTRCGHRLAHRNVRSFCFYHPLEIFPHYIGSNDQTLLFSQDSERAGRNNARPTSKLQVRRRSLFPAFLQWLIYATRADVPAAAEKGFLCLRAGKATRRRAPFCPRSRNAAACVFVCDVNLRRITEIVASSAAAAVGRHTMRVV